MKFPRDVTVAASHKFCQTGSLSLYSPKYFLIFIKIYFLTHKWITNIFSKIYKLWLFSYLWKLLISILIALKSDNLSFEICWDLLTAQYVCIFINILCDLNRIYVLWLLNAVCARKVHWNMDDRIFSVDWDVKSAGKHHYKEAK